MIGTIKKYVKASSLEGAQAAANLGNFLGGFAEIEACRNNGLLYCVDVEINCVSVTSVRAK